MSWFLCLVASVAGLGGQESEASVLAVELFEDVEGRLSPQEAWQLIAQLRTAYPDADPKAKKQAVAALGAASRVAEEERLCQLVLAVGFLGEDADSLAREVGQRLDESRSASVRLACAVTLASLGTEGLERAMAVVKSRNLVGSALACGVAVRCGKPAASVRKALGAVAKADDFRSFLLSQAAQSGLRWEGKKALESARKDQEKNHSQIRVPVSNGLNWGGLAFPVPKDFLAALQTVAQVEGLASDYALPDNPYPGGKGRMFEGYSNFLWHLTGAADELGNLLTDSALPSWEEFSARMSPWEKTVGLLQVVEERHPPSR